MNTRLTGTGIQIDNEGYLLNTGDWSPELAVLVARDEIFNCPMSAWRS